MSDLFNDIVIVRTVNGINIPNLFYMFHICRGSNFVCFGIEF